MPRQLRQRPPMTALRQQRCPPSFQLPPKEPCAALPKRRGDGTTLAQPSASVTPVDRPRSARSDNHSNSQNRPFPLVTDARRPYSLPAPTRSSRRNQPKWGGARQKTPPSPWPSLRPPAPTAAAPALSASEDPARCPNRTACRRPSSEGSSRSTVPVATVSPPASSARSLKPLL
jgi:hypothetical protein